MRFRIPAFYDKVMNGIAKAIFPPPTPVIGRVTALDLTLALYIVLIAAGVIWWTGNWLWGPAVLLSVAMAYIIFEWML